MPPIPGFVQKAAFKKAIAALIFVQQNWDKVEMAARPVIDRSFRTLVKKAAAQGELSSEEIARLTALESHRRRKVKGTSDRYGWTFQERVEVAVLLEKAYRNHPQATWVLELITARLRSALERHQNDSSAQTVDGEVVEDSETGRDSVMVDSAELQRLRKLAGELEEDESA